MCHLGKTDQKKKEMKCFACSQIPDENINSISFLRCNQCKIAVYCSAKCQEKMKEIHNYQCADLKLNPLSFVLFTDCLLNREFCIVSIEEPVGQLVCGQMQQFIPRLRWNEVVPEYSRIPTPLRGDFIGITSSDLFDGKFLRNPHANMEPLYLGQQAPEYVPEQKSLPKAPAATTSLLYKSVYSASWISDETANVTTPSDQLIHVNRLLGTIFHHQPQFERVFVLIEKDVDLLNMPCEANQQNMPTNNWMKTAAEAPPGCNTKSEFYKLFTYGRHDFRQANETVPEWVREIQQKQTVYV